MLETNENKNTTIQNLWDAAKTVQEEKLQQEKITSGNKKKAQIKNLTLQLKQLEKEKKKQAKPKVSRGKKL